MPGKTISDWIVRAREKKVDLENFDTDKIEDLARLRASELPQFDYFELPYEEFDSDNSELKEFLSKCKKVTIHALPNEKARKKGATRRYKIAITSSFEACNQFLKEVIPENPEDYCVALNSWEPNDYGFILISEGERYVRGEIGRSVEKLSHGDETPIASFVLDRAKVGHLEDKLLWLKREEESAARLLFEALKSIKAPFDNFNPIFLEGYFEGVITQTGIKFLDYKTSPAYLKKLKKFH